jgi:hypothetical protein
MRKDECSAISEDFQGVDKIPVLGILAALLHNHTDKLTPFQILPSFLENSRGFERLAFSKAARCRERGTR